MSMSCGSLSDSLNRKSLNYSFNILSKFQEISEMNFDNE